MINANAIFYTHQTVLISNYKYCEYFFLLIGLLGQSEKNENDDDSMYMYQLHQMH